MQRIASADLIAHLKAQSHSQIHGPTTMAPGVAASSPIESKITASKSLSLWLWLVAALVVLMVAVGGATRLTDSGLSITEWKPLLGAIPPLSAADWADAFAKYKTIPEYKLVNEGMSLAEFKFIYWWEWGHRFLGRFIGLVYGLPLILFWVAGAIPRNFKVSLLVVLALGALQGFVGWYMVQSGLTERVDVSQYRLAMHLTLAFVILGALTWLALAIRPEDPLRRTMLVSTLPRWIAPALLALILAQVVLGAFVAGTKAGLAYNTWPLMDGDLVPAGLWKLEPWYRNIAENITAIQFNHRTLAYALLLIATIQTVLIYVLSQNPSARISSLVLCVLLWAQAMLGIWTLLSAEGAIPIGLGVAHQTAAAIVFAVAVWHVRAVLTADRS